MRALAVAGLCLSLPLLSTPTQASFTRDLAPDTIDIVVTNNAIVTPPVLQAAEDAASDIFRNARIDIHWMQDGTQHGAGNPLFSIAMRADGGEGPFAQTLRTRHILGGRTSVFYNRILGYALAHRRNVAHLLGTVIAHEIGHMLLPDMTHSGSGLMRSPWDDEDLTHADLGALRLTGEQVSQIHLRLSQLAMR